MKIIFLTTEGPGSFYLINGIHREFPVSKVFFRYGSGTGGAGGPRWRKLFNLQKIRGHFRHYLENFCFRRERALRDEYEQQHFPPALAEDIKVERVASLNDPQTVEMLHREQADVVLVQGTEILKDEVLAVARREIINLHPAILPQYKGGGLPYWTFYNRDFDKLGVTVHVCTAQLDAGPVLGQAFYRLTPEDEVHQFSHRMNTLFIELVTKVLAAYRDDEVVYTPQTPNPKVYTKKALTIGKQLLARKYFKNYVKSLS